MSEESSEFPFTFDYGELVGKYTFRSHDDLVHFTRHTLPDILSRHELKELKKQEAEDDAAIVKHQGQIEFGDGMHFTGERRKTRRAVPTSLGLLYDEHGQVLLDDKVEFELSFPRGRFVTGFVGTMKPSQEIPISKYSLLWHDYMIDVPVNKFWRGKVMIQRRTEDDGFNVRNHGMNEYMV